MATRDQLRTLAAADRPFAQGSIRNAAQAIGARRLANHVVQLGDEELTEKYRAASAALDDLLDRYDAIVPDPNPGG